MSSDSASDRGQSPKAQKLDVIARGLDLAAVATRHTPVDLVGIATSEAAKLGSDLVRWLAHERISEGAFVHAMSLGRNIAQCNNNALVVLDGLEQTASRFYALQLVMPGALGRTIVYDESLRWISTTQTVLLRHQTCEYVVDTLCGLFASTILEEGDPRVAVLNARIRPVLSRVVDSIHLHITNMGYEATKLPGAIDELPKHYTASFVLSSAIKAIQDRADGDVFIFMEACIVDLVDWVFHHWMGVLCATVNNRVVFEEALGMAPHRLSLVIENHCIAETNCKAEDHIANFKIGRSIGSKLTEGKPVMGVSDPLDAAMTNPLYRTPLYEVRNPFATVEGSLNAKERKSVQRSAQEVVNAILKSPVSMSSGLDLKLDRSSSKTFGTFVLRTPALLQKNLDSRPAYQEGNVGSRPAPRFLAHTSPNSPREIDSIYLESDSDSEGGQLYTARQICIWYPEILATIELAYERCACGCNDKDLHEILEQGIDGGCLVTLTFAETILTIGHALAEAGGADDISNLKGKDSAKSLMKATVAVLGSTAGNGIIDWPIWFRLVCCAITGLDYDMGDEEETFDVSGGILIWCAGSMTIAPIWLDFTKPIIFERSWAVQRLVGTVPGLQSEFGVIETQTTSGSGDIDPPQTVPFSECKAEESENPDIEFVVFSNTGSLYRMLCMVRVGQGLRVIDPFSIYRGSILTEPLTCSHEPETRDDIVFHRWSMEGLIIGWGILGAPADDIPHVAMVGSSVLKRNVALGLSQGSSVIAIAGNCCPSCLAAHCVEKRHFGIYYPASRGKRPRKMVKGP